MAPKRTRDTEDAVDSNAAASQETHKRRKGFTVGPENLPDGTYRRKAQKIKRDLIQKAKVRKAYAKIKAAEEETAPVRSSYYNNDDSNGDDANATDEKASTPAAATLELHPDRQAMLDAPEIPEAPVERRERQPQNRERGRRKRAPKPSAFQKEIDLAEKRKREQDARQKERELKAKEREAMLRAKKPDQHGKRRLGRESQVLLAKIQRTVDSR